MWTGCPLRLEKLENGPFSEFGWKSWKIRSYSPASAVKAGILFLDIIIALVNTIFGVGEIDCF